jgi:hypothetical protein
VKRTLAGALVAVVALLAHPPLARALPDVGAAHPEITLRDSWDRTTPMSRFLGLPTLLLYEDKGSTEQNSSLKAELARLARNDAYKGSIALVAIADVSAYDYWPVRGFVKDAIQDESHKQGTLIYCDWDGAIRGALRLEKARSNVVLYGRDGKVIFAASGPLGDARRDQLLALLRTQTLRGGS